ncbi:MAG: hypothetical protein LBB88_09515, partial [Planctomycetaceae bacterium]|nr:hypothetical protein [Planctomycetaceae bacterium]
FKKKKINNAINDYLNTTKFNSHKKRFCAKRKKLNSPRSNSTWFFCYENSKNGNQIFFKSRRSSIK